MIMKGELLEVEEEDQKQEEKVGVESREKKHQVVKTQRRKNAKEELYAV